MSNTYYEVYLKDGSTFIDKMCNYVDYSGSRVVTLQNKNTNNPISHYPIYTILAIIPYENILKIIRVEETI